MPLLLNACLNLNYHNRISKTTVPLADWAFSPSCGKDSDNEVATEQLTAVVDVTFMPNDNLKIS